MDLSIIIPVYNTQEDYLKECIDSCLKNKYEVIVIDDGSTKDYSEIKNISSIKYIKTDNNGVSTARNIGLSLATKKYVTFLDSDDLLVPNGINEMLNYVRENDIVLSRINIKNNHEYNINYNFYNKSFKIENKRELIESVLIPNNKYTCVDTVWAKIYKKEFLKKNNIEFKTNLKNGEDILFVYECYNKTNDIYFCNEISYIYRTNPYSVCNTYSADLDERFITFLKELNNIILNNQIKEPLFNSHVYRVIIRLFRKFYPNNNYEDFKISLKKLLEEEIIFNAIHNLNQNDLNYEQKKLLNELKEYNYDNLYQISLNSKKLKLK